MKSCLAHKVRTTDLKYQSGLAEIYPKKEKRKKKRATVCVCVSHGTHILTKYGPLPRDVSGVLLEDTF